MKRALLSCLLFAAVPSAALEFEWGDGSKGATPQSKAESSVPRLIDAGDAPTAYSLSKYEMRADIRFYPGGGILNKLNLGVFPRFFIGGGLNVPGLVNAGPVTLVREDVSLLARLVAVAEDDSWPAIAIGWDGPAFNGAELRGLYLSASKEFGTPLGYFQLHGAANSAFFENGWQADKHLRGSGALTFSIRQLTAFGEADELGSPAGPRYSAGARFYFEPVSLGVEFRDLGATRAGLMSSRMLRVSYSGLF